MTLAFIALGSNLAAPLEQVNAAVAALAESPQQPDRRRLLFLPHAAGWDRRISLTTLTPPSRWRPGLPQKRCWIIPSALSCSRAANARPNAGVRARSISISCCLASRLSTASAWTVPHYDMKNRGFMLWPLFEIAPELHFPDGVALRSVLTQLAADKPALW
ncbi:2-amino-4-hydroxy-6-hydroxymethyldihydropteridinepyrophosphokinase [Raoultella terrigena]|uniref:2-amino-4-hydroxy-6-hydroxymethyldihydropteridine pyrophosphokinase n=1 Tax=Raoultella terrigena TaxID=577 RepID=A0A3P8J643_RAOTE|nr:2-amino-4-hydroxy-6-hydroxymethyldihydropteridinepyrophosphokinase [Raoultella terrigena]